jgi:putative ABC transport system permease protein
MFKNYIKIALRNLARFKLYSSINIAGLAIGIAGSLIVFVYVADELSYELMHEKRDNIYRVSVSFGTDETVMKLAGSMPALGPSAVEEIPGVTASVRFRVDRNALIKSGNREFTETNFFFADSNVFEVFTFPLILGDVNALNDPASLVISKSAAGKYFGEGNPIGKIITYNNEYDFIISGVIEDVPQNTFLKCDFIAPYSSPSVQNKIMMPWNQWGEDYTYLLLDNNASVTELNTNLRELLEKNTNEQFASMLGFHVLPLSDIYLKSDMMGELGPTGNINTIYLFSSIALLVLIIASLNFINLSTARSLRRAKEVGLRKVLGAKRENLFFQFFGESLFITLFAVVFSLLLYETANPLLYDYFNVNLNSNPYQNLNFYYILAGIILFVSLLAGIYPAVFLSKYKPVDSLKGKAAAGSSGISLRKSLIVLQFAIAVFLIIGTAVIFKQLNFMRNSDPGFNKENVLIVNYPVSEESKKDKYFVVREAFKSVPGISDVSGAYTLPGINSKEQQTIKLKNSDQDAYLIMQAVGVDYDFIPTLGLKVIEGRNFSEKFGTEENSIIINEAAAKKIGIDDPVGSEVYIPSGKEGGNKPAAIVGVIKDFHIQSYHNTIEPLFLYINPDRFYNIALKFNQKSAGNILEPLKEKWQNILPGQKFEYSFLADKYSSLYDSDEKNGTLFSIFTFLSIFIACLGLFGLSTFMTEVRTKEIGIRKVLGADVKSILLLLSGEFTKNIIISNIIAWPIAYYAVSKWLDDFAYRIEIGFEIFIIAGLAILLIVLFTVSYHVVKVAVSNPVKSLRYE